MQELDPKTKAEKLDTLDQLFDAVRKGDVVMAVAGEIPFRRLLRDNPAAAIQLRICAVGERLDSIAIAVRPDSPDLVRWIDTFLEEHGVSYDAETLLKHKGAWSFGVKNDTGKF
jgi:ABC-type amino acid transport substrate-binding protein